MLGRSEDWAYRSEDWAYRSQIWRLRKMDQRQTQNYRGAYSLGM